MRRYFGVPTRVVLLGCVLTGLLLALALRGRAKSAILVVTVDHAFLPANGSAVAALRVVSSSGRLPAGVKWTFSNGRNLARLEGTGAEVRLQAGVTPGPVTLLAAAPGFLTQQLTVHLVLDPTDQFGDGTPDFLRLESQGDQVAFRRWFAFLAESTYFQNDRDRPAEIKDCAALIRFAYREALRKHDAAWANQWHLPQLPSVGSIRKYDYPHTTLGPGLFRTHGGAFSPEDTAAGTFAEFADAETLRRYNTHFVSRDLSAARAGDLLFFRQQGHRMPFHTMIYLGKSYFSEGGDWLIYHTGPNGRAAGEIRRVTETALLQHPEFSGRPLPHTPAFLGVYRWNILREED